MDEVTKADINAAIPLFVGWGVEDFPEEDAKRIAETFGADKGAVLTEKVKDVLRQLEGIEPDWATHSLVSGSEWAVSELSKRLGYLDEEAQNALKWTYSWWWK